MQYISSIASTNLIYALLSNYDEFETSQEVLFQHAYTWLNLTWSFRGICIGMGCFIVLSE